MIFQAALLLSWTAPIVLAALTLVGRGVRVALVLAPWAALPGLLLAWCSPPNVALHVPWLMMGGTLALDPLAAGLLKPVAMVWLAGGLFARFYAPTRANRSFWSMFLLAMAGNFGLLLAADALEFYLFFALMTFAAYALVINDGSARARHAGKRYIQFAIVGEVLLFAGIALAVQSAADARFAAIQQALTQRDGATLLALVCIIAGFGVKAGVLALHGWLPLAHPAAPVPASAVLSGAMIKAGVIGWLRFLPLGQAAVPEAVLLVALGVGGAFFGVARGVRQSDPKTILAYSSVSQMGAIAAVVGAALVHPRAWAALVPAVGAYVAHHAIAKAALFLGIGGTKGGFSPAAWWRSVPSWAPAVLPALALAGAPFTSGQAVKAAAKAGLPAEGVGAFLQSALWFASAATALLMAWFLIVLWRARGDGKPAGAIQQGLPCALAAFTLAPVAWLAFETPQGGAADLISAIGAVALGAAIAWLFQGRLGGAPATVAPAGRAVTTIDQTSLRSPSSALIKVEAAFTRAAHGVGKALAAIEHHLEDTRWLALLVVLVSVALAAFAIP